MKLCLAVILCLGLAAVSADTKIIKCYTCTDTASCKNAVAVPCSGTDDVCQTIVTGKEVVKKGCKTDQQTVFDTTVTIKDMCFDGGDTRVCACSTDQCNGASIARMAKGSGLVLAMIGLARVFMY